VGRLGQGRGDPAHDELARRAPLKVVAYAAHPREKRHHFLWRFWPDLPGQGGMTVLDRSGTAACSSSASRASPPRPSGGGAYDEINAFERSLADDGWSS
jgi:polyphosphate kinase 2 (PPK2 family)